MLNSAVTFTILLEVCLFSSIKKKSQRTITLDYEFRNFLNKLALLCFLPYGVQ